jgi:hypothetical protein
MSRSLPWFVRWPARVVLAVAAALSVIGLAACTSPPADVALPSQVQASAGTLSTLRFTHPAKVAGAAWTVVDATSGAVVAGSGNARVAQPIGSTIRVWLAADYLSLLSSLPTPPVSPDQVASMLSVGRSDRIDAVYDAAGHDDSIRRMMLVCPLHDTTLVHESWALTKMSTTDLALLGVCLRMGFAAGDVWTGWLFDHMGYAGPVEDALPGVNVASVNGWTDRGGVEYFSCLAIVDRVWSVAITSAYPQNLGVAHGAAQCQTVAAQLSGRAAT